MYDKTICMNIIDYIWILRGKQLSRITILKNVPMIKYCESLRMNLCNLQVILKELINRSVCWSQFYCKNSCKDLLPVSASQMLRCFHSFLHHYFWEPLKNKDWNISPCMTVLSVIVTEHKAICTVWRFPCLFDADRPTHLCMCPYVCVSVFAWHHEYGTW